MADDRQWVGVLQALRHATRGAHRDRITQLLDRRHPQRRSLGLMRRAAAGGAGKATGALSRISRLGGGTTFPRGVAPAPPPPVLPKPSRHLPHGALLLTPTHPQNPPP